MMNEIFSLIIGFCLRELWQQTKEKRSLIHKLGAKDEDK